IIEALPLPYLGPLYLDQEPSSTTDSPLQVYQRRPRSVPVETPVDLPVPSDSLTAAPPLQKNAFLTTDLATDSFRC
ncbi:hypothetical protein ABN254_21635, partial [Providencia rettgeri]